MKVYSLLKYASECIFIGKRHLHTFMFEMVQDDD